MAIFNRKKQEQFDYESVTHELVEVSNKIDKGNLAMEQFTDITFFDSLKRVENGIVDIVSEKVTSMMSKYLEAQETRSRIEMRKIITELMPSPHDYVKTAEQTAKINDMILKLESVKSSFLGIKRDIEKGGPLLTKEQKRKNVTFTRAGVKNYQLIDDYLKRLAEVLGKNKESFTNVSKQKLFFKKALIEYEGKSIIYAPEDQKSFESVRSTIFRKGLADKYITFIIDDFIQPEIDRCKQQLNQH